MNPFTTTFPAPEKSKSQEAAKSQAKPNFTWTHLSLNQGGLLLPENLLMDPDPDSATFVIAVGGAGIDCLRKVQENVHNHIKPGAAFRFLAIDSDPETARNLKDTGYFSIACKSTINQRYDELKEEEEFWDTFGWFQLQQFPGYIAGGKKTSGYRQIGRFFLVDKAVYLKDRLQKEIEELTKNANCEKLNIIILSSLSGGTGAGCMLDVCYIARHVCQTINLYPKMSGFFFLPDVTWNYYKDKKIQIDNQYAANAYETMLQLDQAMKTGFSDYGNVYKYKELLNVAHNQKPVDRCYLISSEFLPELSKNDAYQRSMEMTADYITSFLYDRSFLDFEGNGLAADRVQQGREKDCIDYDTFGNYTIYAPVRELANYLVTEIFCRFQSYTEKRSYQDTYSKVVSSIFHTETTDPNQIYYQLEKQIKSDLKLTVADQFTADLSKTLTALEIDADYRKWQNRLDAKVQAKINEALYDRENETMDLRKIHKACYQAQETLLLDIKTGPVFFNYFMSSDSNQQTILQLTEELKKAATNHKRSLSKNLKEVQDSVKIARYNVDHKVRRNFLDTQTRRLADYGNYLMEKSRYEISIKIIEVMEHTFINLEDTVKRLNDCSNPKLVADIYQDLYQASRSNHLLLHQRTAAGSKSMHSKTNSMQLFCLDDAKADADNYLKQLDYPLLYRRLTIGLRESLGLKSPFYIEKVPKVTSYDATKYLQKFFTEELRPFLDNYKLSAMMQNAYCNIPGMQYLSTEQAFEEIINQIGNNLHLQFDTGKIPAITGKKPEQTIYLEYPVELRSTGIERSIQTAMYALETEGAQVLPIPASDPFTIRATIANNAIPLEAYPTMDTYREGYEALHAQNGRKQEKKGQTFCRDDLPIETMRDRLNSGQIINIQDFNTTNGNKGVNYNITNGPAINVPKASDSDAYIFISYAHKDKDIVLPILKEMTSAGYRIWYDEHIDGAKDWPKDIAVHIKKSAFIISFMSDNYQQSEYCLDEMVYIKKQQSTKKLVIYLRPTILIEGMDLITGRFQHIEYFKEPDKFYRKLYASDGISAAKKGTGDISFPKLTNL